MRGYGNRSGRYVIRIVVRDALKTEATHRQEVKKKLVIYDKYTKEIGRNVNTKIFTPWKSDTLFIFDRIIQYVN